MIRIQCRTDVTPFPGSLISEVLDACLTERWEGGDADAVTVDLMVVDDAEISGMNEQFKGRPRPTDVLAWPDGMIDPDDNCLHLGDIAVSADTAAREARERGIPFEQELVLYALHGLLHLLGWDDQDEASRQLMREAEREELARHGWVPHWETSRDV